MSAVDADEPTGGVPSTGDPRSPADGAPEAGSSSGAQGWACHELARAVREARLDPLGRLPLLVVFLHPKDAPGFVVVRLWLNDAPTTRAWLFPTIDAARAAVAPLGLVRIARHPADDPTIAETWL